MVQLFSTHAHSQVTQTYSIAGNSTFTVPANVNNITIECWGGGGGGGDTRNRKFQAAGGGAGGSYIKHSINVTAGNVFNLFVGAGGASRTAGQSSYFGNSAPGNPAGAIVLAKGGNGGLRPADANGTAIAYVTSLGGTSNLITDNIPLSGFIQSLTGNAGGNGTSASSGSGGTGANGGAGGAGIASSPASNSSFIGNPGTAPGGGGGGAINNDNNTGRLGGAGGTGRVVITYVVCTTFSLTSTNSSAICQGNPAVVSLAGSASSLPAGSYTVTYNLSGSNVATGLTANMTVSVAGSGSFNTNNLANPGNTNITVTSLQSGTCSNTITTNNSTSINIQQEAAISYPLLSYCEGTPVNITVTQTGPTGGTYSASPAGLSINASNGSINVQSSSPGIYTVSYTYSGGCASVASTQISVSALPTMSCPSNIGTCLSASPFILTGASPIGGTYSGPGVSGGLFNPLTAGVGTHTITYTFTNAGNCTNTCSFTITVVNSVPTISAIPVSSYIYSGNTAIINLNSPVSGTTYTWTATSNSASVTGFSAQNSPVAGPISQTLFNQGAGIGEVTYSITPSLTGCSGTPIAVTINLPATTFCQSPGTFQPGSCIINMGIEPQTEGNGLKPFGLLYQLININNIPVYWAINPNKSFVNPLNKQDQVDFTVDGINFKGGAFIIPAPYVPQVQTIINAWVAQGVVVHYAASSFSPPIYDILTRIPKVVLDEDNGNLVENAFYIKAGIPSSAYTKGGIPSQINVCEDVYVLPHADPQDWSQVQKDSLFNFINARGWFFSGCHAVSAIESNPAMRFLSNNGLILWTSHADPILPYSYSLQQGNEASSIASDPLMQFVGKLDGALNGGSEEIYVPSSGWRPTTKVAVFDSNYVNSSVNYPNTAAAVAYGRAYGDASKGIVMYVGGHSLQHGSTAENVAAARLYGNFLLRSGIGTRPSIIPVSIPASANAGDTITLVVNVPPGVSPIISSQWTSDLNGIFLTQTASTQFIVPTVDASTICTVQFKVTDACGRVGLFCATINVNATIKNNYIGASQNVCSSAIPAILSGTVPQVINGDPFSYEWMMSTTSPTSGFAPAPGINNLQNYSPAPVSQTSWFRRRIYTNNGLSVLSSVVEIGLIPGPPISLQPSTSGQSTCQGGAFAPLTVSASGTGLTYQWYSHTLASNSGGTIIPAATDSSYTPTSALQGTLYYYCIITNSTGCSSTSNISGQHTVNASLTILGHPSTSIVTACQGGPISALSINVNGTNVTFQWFFNVSPSNIGGTAISGANAASYTPGLIGSFYYYCIVVAPGSCVPSVRRSNISGLITILPRPVPAINNNSGTSILNCQMTSISLTATGATSYVWTNESLVIGNTAAILVSAPGNYTVTGTGANGCTAQVSISITEEFTEHEWIATPASSDFYWDNPVNWCGGIPTDSTDAYIPDTGAPPVISRATGMVRNIRFDAGAKLIVDGDTLQIFGVINSTGNINAINGSIEMAGISQMQNISGSHFENRMINHLRLSNAFGAQINGINDTLIISGLIDFGKENATLATNGLLTLASGPLHTASVGNMSLYNGSRITGSVTVERYIPDHPKAWQLLAVPTTGQTIHESWQEGNAPLGNNKPGYGTIITSNLATAGNMLGFDLYSAGGPSMKTYNPATNSWVGVSSTNIPIANDKGYMLFVRGDRSVTAFNQTATETRLRTSGQLYTPLDNPPQSIVVPTDMFASVGNPYASAIDFDLLSKSGGLQDVFYLWDPKLTSSAQGSVYGLGSYRTFIKDGTVYKSIPPDIGGTYGNTNSLIQSGQAFFVRATGTDGVLSFTENAKTSSSILFTRQGSPVSSYLSLNLSVINNNIPVLTDGIMLEFKNGYNNGLDALDALKMINTGAENIGILSNSKVLVAERRNMPRLTDTIFLQTGQLKQRTYQIDFQPENFPAGFEGKLKDRFTGLEHPVNLLYDNPYQFTVTSDPSSSAPNRFILIIIAGKRPVTTGPAIQLNDIRLIENQQATLTWQASPDHPFIRFVVEREETNGSFSEQLIVPVEKNNRANTGYTEINVAEGRSRFRIKGIDANGIATYSRVAEVNDHNEISNRNIKIYPNPIVGREIILEFNNPLEGEYLIKIFGMGGKLHSTVAMMIGKNDKNKKLTLDPSVFAGYYTLSVVGPDGRVTTLNFIKL